MPPNFSLPTYTIRLRMTRRKSSKPRNKIVSLFQNFIYVFFDAFVDWPIIRFFPFLFQAYCDLSKTCTFRLRA